MYMCVCVRGFIPATWVAAIITYHPIRISVCQKKQRMKSLQSADCSIGGKGRREGKGTLSVAVFVRIADAAIVIGSACLGALDRSEIVAPLETTHNPHRITFVMVFGKVIAAPIPKIWLHEVF